MSEPMTLEQSLEKSGESVAGLGQALSLALIPTISRIHTAAIQVAIEWESEVNAALNNYRFDWDSLENEMTLKMPERWAEESLIDWYDRLERAGLLDQLDYRWMYQKECWRAVLHSPVWYVGEAWFWLRYEAWEAVRGTLNNANTTEGE